jgi:RecA/RadA recombinase
LAKIHTGTNRTNGVMPSVLDIVDATRKESRQIAAIGAPPASRFLPPDWYKMGGSGVFATGIPFLDACLAGGHAPGEVYGFLGPTGSCKTTMAVMLCVEACRQAERIRRETGKQQYVYLASYEAPMENELRFRAISYAAHIRNDSLEKMPFGAGLDSLSTRKNLKPYEEEMFHQPLSDGKKVLGERERFEKVRGMLDRHMVVLDMTGRDRARPTAGDGYVPEIAGRIQADLSEREKGATVRLVVIDYVGAMCERYMTAQNSHEAELRLLVKRSILAAKTLIAAPFGCPVWAFHQLSGKANAKGVAGNHHYTDAAGSKSFAENLDFAFIVGKPDEHGLCQLTCQRPRRTGQMLKPQILQVKGDFRTVVGVDHLYTFDPGTRMIVEQGLV